MNRPVAHSRARAAARQSAHDREERAADTYARLVSRVRHLAETGPAHQMAFHAGAPEAWERR
jgi:hypothetical protein